MIEKSLITALFIGLAGFAPAATISINMVDGGIGGGPAAATNTAGAVLAGHWNTIAPNGAALNGTDLASLTDDSGSPSGVSLAQSSAQSGWYHSPGPSGFSGTIGNIVMENFADTIGAYTYTFSNVSAAVGALYDVYIYSARDFYNTGTTRFDINGQTQFISNESIVGDYSEGGWSSQALAEANQNSGNYVRFQNVNLDTLIIEVTALEDTANGGTIGSVAAIQLVSRSSGRIAYHTYSGYMAAPVDTEDGHLYVYKPDTDTLTKVTAGFPIENAMNPNFSPDGTTLTFMAIPAGSPRILNSLEIYTLNLSDSSLTRLTSNSIRDEDAKFSPDGSAIIWKRQGQIWTMNADGSSKNQLTFTADEKSGPNYSPDGSKIVYWSEGAANADVWLMSADGSNANAIVSNVNIQDYYPIYRDAGNILYTRWESLSDLHDKIYNYNMGSGTSSRLALNVVGVEDADASPADPTKLVFSSTRSGGDGSYDIYMGRYDNNTVYNLPGANSIHSDLGPCCSPYTYARAIDLASPLSNSNYPAGSSLLLTANLAQDGGLWPGANPKVVFSGAATNEYTGLTDDGTQGDITAGDGVYSKTVMLPSTAGSYAVHAEATSAEPGIVRQVTSPSSTATLLDTSPPLPNPLTWTVSPHATNATTILMVATNATDASGVEYYFEETSGNSGGTDSGWQSSPIYVDTGLTPNRLYSYRTRARDQSTNQNAGVFSEVALATTDGDYDGDSIPDWWEIQHFADPETYGATNNPDHDVHDNLSEYITGTNPIDSNSIFKVAFQTSPSGAILEWSGVTDRWYDVLWTPGLTNSFQLLADFIELPQNSYTDISHSANSEGFYKVEVRVKD